MDSHSRLAFVIGLSGLATVTGCSESALAPGGGHKALGLLADAGTGPVGRADGSSGVTCGATPTRLVDFPKGTLSLVPDFAVSAGGVYYVMDGYLMRVPLGGGSAVRLASFPYGAIDNRGQAIAATRTDVIVAERPAGGVGDGAVVRVPAAGGDRTVLTTATGLSAVAADEQSAYFADSEGVKSVPIHGGPVRLLSDTGSATLSLAGSTLYFGGVSSVNVGGGPVTVFENVPSAASNAVACGQDVCFVTSEFVDAATAPETRRVNLWEASPGGAPRILTGLGIECDELVFDGSTFFVVGGGPQVQSIGRVSRSGNRSDEFPAEPSIFAGGVAVDDACVYWSTLFGDYGGIYSVARSAVDFPKGRDE